MKKILLLSLLLPAVSHARSVRSISTDDIKMSPVYLKMSHSTVLRFEDRPKKIILGNSNYISAEFTGNDVSLQPLDTLNTNLFVYTEKHTYGFHLKVGTKKHDDLLRVRWNDRSTVVYKHKKVRTKKIGKIIRLDKDLTLKISSAKYLDGGIQIIDCELSNKNEMPFDTTEMDTYLTRNNIKLAGQRSAFDSDLIRHGSKARLRFVLNKVQRRGFTLNLWKDEKRYKAVIGRNFL